MPYTRADRYPSRLDHDAVPEPDAHGARVVKNDVGDLRVGSDGQVGPGFAERQKRVGRRHTDTVT